MAYPTKAVANYFIDLANAKKIQITPMKLQKLIYFAHGWHLAIIGEPLIDECVQAWSYGPVIDSIYHEFKEYGSGPIRRHARSYHVVDEHNICPFAPHIPPEDQKTRKLLDRVWQIYAQFTGVKLANMTHQPGTPWARTWSPDVLRGTTISNDEIKLYFEEKAKRKPYA